LVNIKEIVFMTELEGKVEEKVRALIDPETGMSFGDMGLIQSVKELENGVVQIDFVPTSPFCPIAFKFATDIKTAAKEIEGVRKVLVYLHGHAMEERINQTINRE
jgi:metal-sulfur cluster biosynthetic enzyme